MGDDEFGPVCDNPACRDKIRSLEEFAMKLSNELDDVYGQLHDARENAA